MTIQCFEVHKDYLQEWEGGITICLLCAAKHQLAQSVKTAMTRLKMLEAA